MYKIHYIKRGGQTVVLQARLAPSPTRMFTFRPMGSEFAARWFPSRKAWRLYDLRKFKRTTLYTGKDIIKAPKHSFENADLDAIFAFAALKTEGPET